MALIKCAECGKEISNKATTCPNCGCPIEKEKKKVRIVKIGKYALRCAVFIDNQSIGQVGVGSQKSIELMLPIGTHYISTITQVKNQSTLIGTDGTNAIATPLTTSTSQEQDGKQFEINENDELIEIEILTKGSFSGSTGRCVVGNINKYDKTNISVKNEELKKISENQQVRKQTTNIILDIVIAIILFLIVNIFSIVIALNPTISLLLGLVISGIYLFKQFKKISYERSNGNNMGLFKSKEEKEREKLELREEIKKVWLKSYIESGFNVSKAIYIPDYQSKKNEEKDICVIVDTKNKQWAYTSKKLFNEGIVKTFSFKDVIKYDLTDNKDNIAPIDVGGVFNLGMFTKIGTTEINRKHYKFVVYMKSDDIDNATITLLNQDGYSLTIPEFDKIMEDLIKTFEYIKENK